MECRVDDPWIVQVDVAVVQYKVDRIDGKWILCFLVHKFPSAVSELISYYIQMFVDAKGPFLILGNLMTHNMLDSCKAGFRLQ
jgi:hypothetical protein